MNKNNREEYKQKAIRMYVEDKLSMSKIAKQLEISDGTVKKFLVEENIPIQKIRLNYSVRDNLFDKIRTEEDAYWLGLMYADGNVSTKGYNVELDLKAEDKYLVQQFKDYCGVTKPIKEHIIRRNDKEYISYCCRFANKTAHENLEKLGCISAKSLVLKCPTKEQVPDELLSDFIRGYCDGDGYVRWEEIRHKEVVLLGTENFLTGIIKRMNWEDFASVRPDGKSKNFRLEIWQMQRVYEILTLLYKDKDLCLKRKQQVYYKAKSYMERQPMKNPLN